MDYNSELMALFTPQTYSLLLSSSSSRAMQQPHRAKLTVAQLGHTILCTVSAQLATTLLYTRYEIHREMVEQLHLFLLHSNFRFVSSLWLIQDILNSAQSQHNQQQLFFTHFFHLYVNQFSKMTSTIEFFFYITTCFAHENMKKLPSKIGYFSKYEQFSLYCPDCPNGPKLQIQLEIFATISLNISGSVSMQGQSRG